MFFLKNEFKEMCFEKCGVINSIDLSSRDYWLSKISSFDCLIVGFILGN